jgi:hypothetical protein
MMSNFLSSRLLRNLSIASLSIFILSPLTSEDLREHSFHLKFDERNSCPFSITQDKSTSFWVITNQSDEFLNISFLLQSISKNVLCIVALDKENRYHLFILRSVFYENKTEKKICLCMTDCVLKDSAESVFKNRLTTEMLPFIAKKNENAYPIAFIGISTKQSNHQLSLEELINLCFSTTVGHVNHCFSQYHFFTPEGDIKYTDLPLPQPPADQPLPLPQPPADQQLPPPLPPKKTSRWLQIYDVLKNALCTLCKILFCGFFCAK